MSTVFKRRLLGGGLAVVGAAAVGVPMWQVHAGPAESSATACEVSLLPGGADEFGGAYATDSTGEYAAGYTVDDADIKTATLWKGEEPTVIEVPGATESQLEDVNPRGQAVGSAVTDDGKRFFGYDDGEVAMLRHNGVEVVANSVNDDGVISGTVGGEENSYPAQWTLPNPEPRELELPDGASKAIHVEIDDAGDMLGYADADGRLRPYVWRADGEIDELPLVSDDDGTGNYLFGAWDRGWALGNHATEADSANLIWQPGEEPVEYTDVERDTDINRDGQVVGNKDTKPVLASPEGDVEELPLPDGFTTFPEFSLNDDGTVIVAQAVDEDGSRIAAAKWSCG